jgi:hypothetical protein
LNPVELQGFDVLQNHLQPRNIRIDTEREDLAFPRSQSSEREFRITRGTRASELPPLAHGDVVRCPVGFPRLNAIQLEEEISVRAVLIRIGGHPEVRSV